MEPASEQDLPQRAVQAARRLSADLDRDAADLKDFPDGQPLAQAAALAVRRVADELQTATTEGAA